MAKVLVDGQTLELTAQDRLNGIQAASRLGISIPHYCWHPGLSVVASCRMCLVETGRVDPQTGAISMMPKLVPACQTPATDGTVFVTDSEKVRAARAMVEEDLLIRHPVDCPICDKAGECHLQDYHFQHGRPERRADIQPFHSRRRPLGETVTLFVDRCVMCTRCVRFTREISGTAELMIANRGAHEEIDVFPGYPLDNKMSGNVVDLCPVGALGDIDFLYSQRVWFMKKHASVCAGCSQGCSIFVEENQDHIYRLKPRENSAINHWWMCDEGRYGFDYVHREDRLTGHSRRSEGNSTKKGAEVRAAASLPDGYDACELDEAMEPLRQALGKGHWAAILSPFLTVEEAYLLTKLIRQHDSTAIVVVGPIPTRGDDETFAKGFTIRAEKCPNRRGVEEVVRGVTQEWHTLDDLLKRISAGEIDGLWCTGGYPEPWLDPTTAQVLATVKTTVVQDIFPNPLWRQATWRLAGVTFAERAGSFVNSQDRLQAFDWAIRPPAGAVVEGHVYWRLLGRLGLYSATTVRRELAREVAYFAAADGEIGAEGIDLKIVRLAGATAEKIGASV